MMSLCMVCYVQFQQERCGHTGGNPAKGHTDNEGIGVSLQFSAG